jgi:hypothetical protein
MWKRRGAEMMMMMMLLMMSYGARKVELIEGWWGKYRGVD